MQASTVQKKRQNESRFPSVATHLVQSHTHTHTYTNQVSVNAAPRRKEAVGDQSCESNPDVRVFTFHFKLI